MGGRLAQDAQRLVRPQVLQDPGDGPPLLEALAHLAQNLFRLRGLSQCISQLSPLTGVQGEGQAGRHARIARIQTRNGERKTGSSHGKTSTGKERTTPRAVFRSATPATGWGEALGEDQATV